MTKNKPSYKSLYGDLWACQPCWPWFETRNDFDFIWKHYVKMRYYNDRRMFSLLHISFD